MSKPAGLYHFLLAPDSKVNTMKGLILGALVVLALAACGGGGGGENASAVQAVSANADAAIAESAEARKAPRDRTLVPQEISVVNTTTVGEQRLRAMGATSDGGYTVAWISGTSTLSIQHYDSLGANAGTETQLHLTIQDATEAAVALAFSTSSVAVLRDGSVVVGYLISRHAINPTGPVITTSGVYFQRFDANGVRLMGETEVHSRAEVVHSRSPHLNRLQVVALADGGFVVGWTLNHFTIQFPNNVPSLQRYDSQAQPVGGVVNVVGQFPTQSYSIVADAHGGFTYYLSQVDTAFNNLVSVTHYSAGMTATEIVPARAGAALLLPLRSGYVLFASDSTGAYRQMLDSAGNPTGPQTPISAMPDLATELADGTFVVFWAANGGHTAQRYDSSGVPMGDLLTINTSAGVPGVAALLDGGFALAWSAANTAGDLDVFTQRFIEVLTNQRKACLEQARDMSLRGQERKAFMASCLA